MISALDLLKFRLSRGGMPNVPNEVMGLRGGDTSGPGLLGPQMSEADRRLQAMGPNLPEYLPQAVWDSILNKPDYGEGRVIPGPRNPLMEQEAAAGAFRGPQREEPLMQQLHDGRQLAREGVWPMPEGAVQSYSPYSPYSSPLNQMMQLGRRAPLALY